MNMNNIETAVLQYVENNPECSALQILRQLKISFDKNITKTQINKILYDRKFTKYLLMTEYTPPLWQLKRELPVPEASIQKPIVVLINLDNVSDCLQHLQTHINDGQLSVIAFANKTFNGFGVKGEINSFGYEVKIATETHKNIADTMLMWTLGKLCQLFSGQIFHFIVVSKGARLSSLPHIVREGSDKHRCTVVKDWSELRLYVE